MEPGVGGGWRPTAGGTMVTRVTLGAVHPETTAVSLMQAFTLNAQALPQAFPVTLAPLTVGAGVASTSKPT